MENRSQVAQAAILFLASPPLDEASVQVEMSSDNNRRPLPSSLESSIGDVWRTRVAENPKLWNGSKFRLKRIESSAIGARLSLGITNYRDYLGTNWSHRIGEMKEFGRKNFADEQACLADPLGVSAFLISEDDDVVFMRRSDSCAEAQGLLDLPGGHPEPSSILGDVEIDVAKFDPKNLKPDVVRAEVFQSILKEIRDEINLPISVLSRPQLMGVASNFASGSRCSIQFHVATRLSTPEIQRLYSSATQAEADESTGVVFVPRQRILRLGREAMARGAKAEGAEAKAGGAEAKAGGAEAKAGGAEETEAVKKGAQESWLEMTELKSSEESDADLWRQLAPNAKGGVMIAAQTLAKNLNQ